MSIAFSDSTGNTGGVEQVRKLMRVDSSQWPTVNISNSFNNWLDFLTGYAIGADRRFQWDNTQHTKLPEGTLDLVAGQSDYSFLTDQQGNNIVTLLGVSLVNASGLEMPLVPVDREDPDYDQYTFGNVSGTPTSYDKIADNIIRLNMKPSATDAANYDLKLRFQRTSPYFSASDTTKTSGFSPLLDRGFVIAAAYDGALTLGLPNLQALGVERQLEVKKVEEYFGERNHDFNAVMRNEPFDYE